MTSPVTQPSDHLARSAVRPTWRRRLRRALITLAIVLLVLAGVAYMLPIWACTEQGRVYALQQINRHLNGTLNVNSWRFGWFSGIRMEGVTLADPSGRTVLHCSSLQTDLTLWAWLWGHYDLGSTTIANPRADIQRYPDGSNDLSRIFAGPTGSTTRYSWRDRVTSLRGAIQINDGQLTLRPSAAGRPIQLNGLYAEIPIASSTTTVHLTVHATSTQPDGNGPVSILGNLPGLSVWTTEPLALLRDLEVNVHALPTSTTADWLGLRMAHGWDDTLGPTIEELTFTNHPTPGSPAVLRLRGSKDSSLDWELTMQESNGRITFSFPKNPTHPNRSRTRIGRPVAELLAYVNPVLKYARSTGTVELTLTDGLVSLPARLQPPGPPPTLSASGLLTFTNLELQPVGLLQDAWVLAAPHGATLPNPDQYLAVSVPPTRIDVADGRLAYRSLVLGIPGWPQTTFSGSVGFDGSVRLLMNVSSNSEDLLGGTHLQVPVRGTVAQPVVDPRQIIR